MFSSQFNRAIGEGLLLLIVVGSLIVPGRSLAQIPANSSRAAWDSISHARIALLERELEAVRRDQLNYSIERDLLRETYTTNYGRIQLGITVVLGLFAILSFFGFKSVGALQQQFRDELASFKGAKARVEAHLKSVEEDQKRFDSNMQALSRKNEEQDKRLRGLELREKAAKLAHDGNHALALDYLVVGLEMSPNDTAMIALKADCLSKLGRTADVIEVLKDLVFRAPDERVHYLNLFEAYLLSGRVEDFDQLAKTRPEAIASRPLLEPYFIALRSLIKGDEASLRATLSTLLGSVSPEQSKKLFWNFQDARIALAPRKDLANKGLFLTALSVLEGRSEPAALKALLA